MSQVLIWHTIWGTIKGCEKALHENVIREGLGGETVMEVEGGLCTSRTRLQVETEAARMAELCSNLTNFALPIPGSRRSAC